VLSSEPEAPKAPAAGTPLVRQTISRDQPAPKTAAPGRPERRQALRPPPAPPAPPTAAPAASPARPAKPTPRARPAHPSRAGSPATTKSPPATPPSPRPFAALEDVAQIAAAARTSVKEPKSPATRTAFIAGAGVAVAVVGVVLAVRFLSGGHETHTANTAPVAAPPHYSQEVADLVTHVESDFTQDDFRKAQADVQLLRSLAPDHPRLPFFQSLIAHHAVGRHAEPAEKVATARAPTQGQASKPTPKASPPPAPKPVEAAPSSPASPAPASPAPASPPRAAPSTSEEGTQFAAATTPIAAPRGPMTDAPPATSAVNSTFSGRTVEDSAGSAASVPTPAPASNSHKLGSGEPPPVVAPAQLTRRVAPEYPPAAVRQGVEGFAEVRFTVTAKGTVTDVSIVESTPPDMFDKAAIDAVRRWRYEPRTVDGQPTETQLQVRLQFRMDSKK